MKFSVGWTAWLTRVCVRAVRQVRDHIVSGHWDFSVLYRVTMNTNLFHGMPYPYSYHCGAGVLPSTGTFFSTPGCHPNQRSAYQPAFYQGNYCEKIQAFPIHLAFYHQFLYNFSNSERYHPRALEQKAHPNQRRQSGIRHSQSSSDIRYNLKEELLELKAKKLSIREGSVESVATEASDSNQSLEVTKSRSESPHYTGGITGDSVDYSGSTPEDSDLSLSEEDEDSDSGMHPRGVKRQPEQRGRSPTQKRPRSEERELTTQSRDCWSEIRNDLTQEKYQQISDAILEFYEKKEQAQDLYVKKMQLRDALYAIMRDVFPYCGLYVVGSSMNGFGSDDSDMDLCLMLSYNEIDQRREATEILRILQKALRGCSFLKDICLIRAKVPILKFKDKISNVECDLNINNSVGIRNTHLLNAYSRLDWRVSCLVLFVKHWAKAQKINDASQGTISSYSLVLMVIHYLQCGCNPALVPNLQAKYPHKFDVSADIRLLTLNEKLPQYKSPNKQTLGELFLGFLDYYANHFNFSHDAISVRLGKRLQKEVVMKQNPVNQWKYLCIEEPFNLSNTARSVFDHATFQHILHVIRKSHQILKQKGDVKAIISRPL